MVTRKIGPALAAGCTVVLKSPGETPFSANALAVLAQQAGVPPGVINIITCLANTPQIGQLLCTSSIIRKVSFTGSTRIGRLLMAQSSSTIKKLSLELGGNAPFIVFDDADLDLAIREVVTAKFKGSGQTCVCANRIFVHDRVFDEFVQHLKEATSNFRVGSGHEPSTTHGPLISTAAVEKVARLVDDAVSRGAKVIAGGKRRPDIGPCFYEPTILTDVDPGLSISREEIFGPVAVVHRFDSEKQVLTAANDCDVGLAAYLFTQDLNRATRLSEQIQSGMVAINCGSVSDAPVPWAWYDNLGYCYQLGQRNTQQPCTPPKRSRRRPFEHCARRQSWNHLQIGRLSRIHLRVGVRIDNSGRHVISAAGGKYDVILLTDLVDHALFVKGPR
uniref:Succinate-semialdehyde dehydrogenase [NADP(+)] n=1 Tax=Talaromyces marneffei PM1 TaxID=1077442 RepID=A0A093X7V9_TALMA